MNLEDLEKVIEEVETQNAVYRNPDLEEELREYSQDLSVTEAEEYWREVYSISSSSL